MSTLADGLRGIFYSEFHPKLGPELVFQVPINLLPTSQFDTIKQYIITKPELCNRLVTITLGDYAIVSYPVSIPGKHYPRNHLLFTVSFVLREDADVSEYSPIIQKLALTLRSLETESAFIAMADTRATLGHLLESVFQALKTKGECEMQLNPANKLRLKLLRPPRPAPPVEQHMVPILVRKDLPDLLRDLDLATARILPFLDGVAHVKKIAVNAQTDLRVVQRCIQCLVQCNAVCLVDPFQFSSIYVLTHSIRDLFQSPALQDECVRFVAKTRRRSLSVFGSTSPPTANPVAVPALPLGASATSLLSQGPGPGPATHTGASSRTGSPPPTPLTMSHEKRNSIHSISADVSGSATPLAAQQLHHPIVTPLATTISRTATSTPIVSFSNTVASVLPHNSHTGSGWSLQRPGKDGMDASSARLQHSVLAPDKHPAPPTFGIIFKLYCDMVLREHPLTVQAFAERHADILHNIDVRRLVQFGLMKGILRHVRMYPLREPNALVDPSSDPRLVEVIPYLDGKHSLDAICCQLELSAKQLSDILDTDPYTIIFRT